MPITRATLIAAQEARRRSNFQVDEVTRSLTSAWDQAWQSIVGDWDAAVADAVASVGDGRWPTPAALARLQRVQVALEATEKTIRELSDESVRIINGAVPTQVEEGAAWQARMIGTQMPGGDVPLEQMATVGANFARADPSAIQAIVSRTTQQVTALHWPLSGEATTAMNRRLIQGVTVGKNPRTAASRMMRDVEGRFNGGLGRALNISRTEMLDAHRAAAQAQDIANADVMAGWEWQATFDTRTCPSCLAKHGSRYEITDPGPLDHQQGRCARLPVTKTWAEMGISAPEPPGLALPSAQSWYDSLSPADQVRVMGPARQAGLADGTIGWSDLSSRRSTSGWRDSYAPTPLKDLEARP